MAEKYTVTMSSSTYESLKLLLLLNRVSFAYQPETIKFCKSVRLVWRRKYQILSLGVIIASVLLSIYGVTVNLQNELIHRIRLTKASGKIITFLDYGYLIFTTMIIPIILFANFKHFSRYVELISEVDMILKYTSKSNSDTYVLYITLISTGFVFVSDICIWSSLLPKHQIVSYVLHQLPVYFTYYMQLLAIIDFHFLVKLLSSRVLFLSNSLQDFCKLKISTTSMVTKGVLVNTLQSPSNFQKLDMVHLYDLLYEASLSLNNFYGIALMFALVGCLLHLLVTPYDLYLQMLNTRRHYSFIFSQTIWMLGHTFRLFLIVNPCERISNQLENLSAILIRSLWRDHRFNINQVGL
ncbi:unnamed protein product [Callosobruchus maculatus]|uniref:Gustatory receptor n=2 Tax=Callosobruchus maculatus TaxID=64391 RepID=A0A653DL45_CALMS|nr:unnamed protein product [Callosobruchus maculatus]